MTNTYRTGNPVGSSSPKDLHDNASNFDEASLSKSTTFTDRLGDTRKTLAGYEKDFSDFLAGSGFETVHLTYVVGSQLTVSRPTQLIDYSGSTYRVKTPASFPVTLSGVWANDRLRLTEVADTSLRQSLASSSGDSLIGVAPAVVTMVTRTQQEKNRDEISAAWFGVKAGSSDMTGALKNARDYFQSIGGGTINLPWGNIYAADIEIPRSVAVKGKGKYATTLRPVAAGIGQILRMTGGLSEVSDLAFANDSAYSVKAIQINKGSSEDNLQLRVKNVFGSGFTRFAESLAGDCIHFADLNLVNNKLGIAFNDDGRNGSITGTYILGGNGLLFQKNLQGVEGFRIMDSAILPGAGGTYGITLTCGLDIKLFGVVIDQIVNGQGMVIDASNNPIQGVKSFGCWYGRQVGAAGADYGVYVTGDVRAFESVNDTFTGWTAAGIFLNGSAGKPIADTVLRDSTFYNGDRCLRDIQLNYSQRTLIDGAKHSGTSSIVEGAGCDGRVTNGSYSDSVKPAILPNGLKYGPQVAGMVMRNSGSAVVPTGSKQVAVNHGLSYVPTPRQIQIQPNMFPNNTAGELVVTVPNATQFVVTSRNDPGASNLGIDWVADINE